MSYNIIQWVAPSQVNSTQMEKDPEGTQAREQGDSSHVAEVSNTGKLSSCASSQAKLG